MPVSQNNLRYFYIYMSQHNINHLLQQVDLISKKYEQIEELTGENFNVFDILGVRSNELSHSSFICYLLDVKGKHGQKDLFLKLFIKQLENRFTGDKAQVLNKFQTERSHSITEMSLGNKTQDVSNGGRIDIIIKDGTNNIIIENKIYASDQEKQLVRYFNHDRNAPLLYLTLGDEMPSKDSISHGQIKLKENIDFISISYKNDIKNWIEESIKAVYDKPLIRETLRQYVFLINELTNESNNKIMSKEIIEFLKKDIESTFTIVENFDNLKDTLLEDFFSKVKANLVLNSIVFDSVNFRRNTKDTSVIIKKDNWVNTNLQVNFYIENKDLFIGVHDNIINENIRLTFFDEEICKEFNIRKINTNDWYVYGNWKYFEGFKTKEFWINIQKDDFVNELTNELISLVNYVDVNIYQKLIN